MGVILIKFNTLVLQGIVVFVKPVFNKCILCKTVVIDFVTGSILFQIALMY